MDRNLLTTILEILNENRLLSLATVRTDGWPQATTVGYGSRGLILYFLCSRDSQKARNIRRWPKVSLTINKDFEDIFAVKGLSMAAAAEFVTSRIEIDEAWELLMAKYPGYRHLPRPAPETVNYVRLTPSVISVLNYSKTFGHTDLVKVSSGDFAAAVSEALKSTAIGPPRRPG